MKKTLLAILILLIISRFEVSAQYETQRMTNFLFTTVHGLSSTKITCILQDDRDFLWIGTEDGLNRFNGYDFTVYKKVPNDTLSLVNNHITALYQDSQKRIWVATMAGLECYDFKLEGFVNQSLNLPDPIVRDNRCRVIMEDSKGYLWFAVSGYGALRYSPETNESKLFSYSRESASPTICSNYIYAISEDQKGRMWFASNNNGVSVYDPTDNSFQNFNRDNTILSSNVVFDLDIRSNGDILLSTLRDGLVVYNTEKEEFILYKDVFKDSFTQLISCALEDEDGKIIVGTKGKGAFVFDPETRKLTRHPMFREFSETIGTSQVQFIYRGNFTYVWFALNHKGVFVTGYEHSGFKTLSNLNYESNSLSRGAVTGITTDKGNNLWISTEGGGLNFYNPVSRKFTHYTYDINNDQSISDNNVTTVFCDSKNRIWAGTQTGGLCLFNRGNNTFTTFKYSTGYPQIDNNIRSIQEDKTGALWLGSGGGGIIRFDPEEKSFESFNLFNTNGTPKNYITKLFIDSKNRLWIGSYFSLSYMNIETLSMTTFDLSDGLSDLSIYSITEDEEGTIWVGTADGLNKFNPESNSFMYVFPKTHLHYSPVINGIVPDGKKLWLSTNHGIICYDTNNEETNAYYTNSGLQSNEFILGSYYKSPSGEIFFGGVNGLNCFFPENIYDSHKASPVYITGLKILNKTVAINEEINGRIILKQSLEFTDKIKLKQNEKSFTLDFISMGVFDPYATVYACKMEGFDKDWVIYDYTQRNVTYTNLNPGTYTFHIKASSNPAVWGDDEKTLTIIIEPAIWNTWWAKLSYVIIAILSLLLLFRFILTRIREKDELRIERLRVKQQEEINDAKSKFFMNITHEFRTPLTLIISPLERLVRENDSTKRMQIGLLILRNVSRLQRLINQILDVNKIEEQKMFLHVEHFDVVSFVAHTISAFDELTQKKKVKLTYTSTPDKIDIWYDPDLFDKILNNLLYNAYKFTEEGGEICVDIHIEDDGKIMLTIRDTGVGMDKETIKHIFERFAQGKTRMWGSGTGIGMNLVKSIVDMHKGTIAVESEEGKGSAIYLSILPGNSHYKPEEIVLSQEMNHPDDNKIEFFQEDATEDIFEYDDGNMSAFFTDTESNTALPKEKQYTILLVEDDNDMREFIKQELEKYYIVKEAVNGQAGLELAQKMLPDLIITDVMMPEMDGVEMSHFLRSNPQTSHIPIIILTAQGDLGHRLEGLETGADSYISKPFSIKYLKLRVRKLIEVRQLMKERFSKSINMEAQEMTLTSTDERLLQKAIDYIRNNIENTDLSVEGMSKALGLSRTHLHRKLKALTGQSPVDFIRIIRMKQAAYLLSTGKLSVSEVGYKVGYNTPSYFSSSFNTYFGMSPSAYMEKVLKETKGPTDQEETEGE